MHRPFKYKRGDLLQRTYFDLKRKEAFCDTFIVLETAYRVKRYGDKNLNRKRVKEYVVYLIEEDERHMMKSSSIDNPVFLHRSHSGKPIALNYWTKISRD